MSSKITPADQFLEDHGEVPTKPFPTHCLPPVASEMVEEISRVCKVPTDIPAACVLGTLSAAVGAGIIAETRPGLKTRANLHLLGAALSGSGKSVSCEIASAPLHLAEGEMVEKWNTDTLPELLSNREILESEISTLKRPPKKDESITREARLDAIKEKKQRLEEIKDELAKRPRLIVEETTPEALARIMAGQKWETLTSFSSDAREAIDLVMGKHAKKDSTAENVYLKGFSGDPITIDRVGGTEGPFLAKLNKPCLSVMWLVQPDKLEKMMGSRSLSEGGFVSRFLIFSSSATMEPEDENPSGIIKEVYDDYSDAVITMIESYRMSEFVNEVTASPAAARVFRDYQHKCAARSKGDLSDVTSHVSRWPEQARRIGALLHATSNPNGCHMTEISESIAVDAVEIAEWFAERQMELMETGRMVNKIERFQKVKEITESNEGKITPRDIVRHRVTPDTKSAITLLGGYVEEGRLKGPSVSRPKGGGTPKKTYFLPNA